MKIEVSAKSDKSELRRQYGRMRYTGVGTSISETNAFCRVSTIRS